MSTIRQSLVDALSARLKTITTVNGYSADLGVYEWLVTPLEEEDLPAVIFRDTSDILDTDEIGSRRKHELTFELDVATSETASADATRELLRDILTAIGTDKTFGGLAYDTEPLTVSLEVSETDQRIAGGQIIIEVKYYTSTLWTI